MLTWATSIVFGIFLLLAIVLNLVANARDAADQPAAADTANAARRSSGPAGARPAAHRSGRPAAGNSGAPSTPGGSRHGPR